jgi:hypothetical protein
VFIAPMMVAVSTSETSIDFFETARRNNPEDNCLHTRRREDLKSRFMKICPLFRNLLR